MKEIQTELQKFGKLVKHLREQAELTQDALAFQAGIGRVTLQRIEAGTQAVSITHFFSIARALQMQPADFFKDFDIEIDE